MNSARSSIKCLKDYPLCTAAITGRNEKIKYVAMHVCNWIVKGYYSGLTGGHYFKLPT